MQRLRQRKWQLQLGRGSLVLQWELLLLLLVLIPWLVETELRGPQLRLREKWWMGLV